MNQCSFLGKKPPFLDVIRSLEGPVINVVIEKEEKKDLKLIFIEIESLICL